MDPTMIAKRAAANRLSRRTLLRLAAASVSLPAVSRVASAQTYPTKPVRVVVGFPAGGPADILARLMGQWFAERLGQPFIIENRPGAGTNIGTEVVVRAPPDGYTLLWVTSVNTTNTTLYDRLNFNFIRDIAPVAGFVREPLVMVVHPSVPARTVSEFITYAKANSGKINMASSGNGTNSHLAGELFKMMTGVNMLQVPYRGAAPALTDLLAGQVQVFFVTSSGAIEYIKAGRVRALAVATTIRLPALPEVPPLGEQVPGFEASAWHGIGAPRGTPIDIILKLNKEIAALLADLKMSARLADLGTIPFVVSPSEFGRLITDETEKWAKVAKFAGVKAE
jgi:tripartite-type tricarboxylate transporter receptor subunit TctC